MNLETKLPLFLQVETNAGLGVVCRSNLVVSSLTSQGSIGCLAETRRPVEDGRGLGVSRLHR
jgi:hypothetical protein